MFAALTVTATVTGGKLLAPRVVTRPLHVLPDGQFAVVWRDSLWPIKATGPTTGIVSLSAKPAPKGTGRAAKLSDVGQVTKAAEKASSPSVERSPAQRAATIAMLEGRLAKASKAERPKIEKALAKARANAAASPQPVKAEPVDPMAAVKAAFQAMSPEDRAKAIASLLG